jgi:hypothetical protein
VKYIQELKEAALRMSLHVQITTTSSLFVRAILMIVAMDVDHQPDEDNAPRKSLTRRRISENLDVASGDSEPSMPTQEDLDKFLERLVHMENVISTLQNDQKRSLNCS